MLRGRDGVAARRVHHDYAAARGGLHIHIIDPDAGAPDHAQLRAGFQDRGGDLGLTAHDQAAEFGNNLDQVGLGQAGLNTDFQRAVAREFLDAAGRDGISDEDFWRA